MTAREGGAPAATTVPDWFDEGKELLRVFFVGLVIAVAVTGTLVLALRRERAVVAHAVPPGTPRAGR